MIVDRQKELIKYKGFQGEISFVRSDIKYNFVNVVPPAELESVLLEHPDVADVGVVGVESVSEATELPRYAFSLEIFSLSG